MVSFEAQVFLIKCASQEEYLIPMPFLIVITADDIQVGLERSFYEVSESDELLEEVCVTASFPDGAQDTIFVMVSTQESTQADAAASGEHYLRGFL